MAGFTLLAEKLIPLDEIPEPKLRQLVDYWREKAGGKPFALRDDIDPGDILDLISNIRIAMIEPEGVFRFRLYGSEATNPDQVDMTGQTTAAYPDPGFRDLVDRHYGEVAADGVARCWHVVAAVDQGRYEYQRVVLPLSYGGGGMDALLVKSARIANDALLWKL